MCATGLGLDLALKPSLETEKDGQHDDCNKREGGEDYPRADMDLALKPSLDTEKDGQHDDCNKREGGEDYPRADIGDKDTEEACVNLPAKEVEGSEGSQDPVEELSHIGVPGLIKVARLLIMPITAVKKLKDLHQNAWSSNIQALIVKDPVSKIVMESESAIAWGSGWNPGEGDLLGKR
ncbi:hypothetical protein NDU88_001552 [Pleurodeles waltl]|uniref:Uncharacterized protein n=1 Tax=Pleurodeles waltl TaxID=8319 RepID=A0AAV7R7G0_PLEWA|nr:hypothetical protein NDU88_001552 [Pleurodeles waltl]